MSTPMVTAILEGRKSQTRRVIKPCSTATLSDDSQPDWVFAEAHCPFGQVGDTLWVRETFVLESDEEYQFEPFYKLVTDRPVKVIPAEGEFSSYHLIPHYRATEPEPMITEGEDEKGFLGTKWRPSIFMPRWASRITLRITDIRPERLQDITEKDAIAEGIEITEGELPAHYHSSKLSAWLNFKTAREAYYDLWDTINPKYPFSSNPFVWALSFEMRG